MEKEIKTCPYCGEEIMATAKKCKHCGEWLIEDTSSNPQQQTTEKDVEIIEEDGKSEENENEGYFSQSYLFDSTKMTILFWATIIGSVISSLHSSGIAEMLGEMNAHRGVATRILAFFAGFPEIIGLLLGTIGEIIFMFLLMKVFSNLHKPLKEWFITYIVVFALVSLIFIGNPDKGSNTLLIFSVIGMIIEIILGIKIVTNYEESTKELGWYIIGYPIVTIIATLIIVNIQSDWCSYAEFFISVGIDYFYYGYLRNVLSKS